MEKAVEVASKTAKRHGCGPVTSEGEIAILSVFGIGIRTHVGVGVRMFKALADAGINVDMINTSEVRVNVVVDADKGEAGLKSLQAAVRGCDLLGYIFSSEE